MSLLLETILAEWDQAGRPGSVSNPRVLEYLKTVGLGSDDETSWCSAFLYWATGKAGINDRPARSKASARSWLTVGQAVTEPKTGDIVIYWRESITSWKGHVGMFMRWSDDKQKIYTLGGNQTNRVSIALYDANKVLGFRRLR